MYPVRSLDVHNSCFIQGHLTQSQRPSGVACLPDNSFSVWWVVVAMWSMPLALWNVLERWVLKSWDYVRTMSITITQVSEEEREEESGLLLQHNRQSQDWGTLPTILRIYLMPHVTHVLSSCLMVWSNVIMVVCWVSHDVMTVVTMWPIFVTKV